MRHAQESRPSLGDAALTGALAALVGGAVMKVAWESGRLALGPQAEFASPTRGAVDVLAAKAGATLSDGQRTAASAALYGGAMAAWGAVYGAVQSRLHPPLLVHGLLLGGLVYAANFTRAAGLTKAGVVPAFGDQTPRQRELSLAAHAVFGLATAAAYDALGGE
ncbi:hypothetical protein tb265_13030 [Gemmatimonadetes bacterium T265]|nr:hypothetical protein tb265_13030 [Gemmatimonadetes bacterium T265]